MSRQTKDRILSWKVAAIWLVALFAIALTLRIAFTAESSYDEEGDRFVYTGNDPYYHDRAVLHIVETGESLVRDPSINYPHGGNNANPPIYDWTTAVLAGALKEFGGMEPQKAVSVALNIMVAFWGAITVFPVYMIGRELFERRAGLWAAFLMAVSPQHITRGLWGFADHDATTLFFIVLALAFLIKALRRLDRRDYVTDWRNSTARAAGIRAAVSHNKQSFIWATLSGLALGATALVWKGYPYVLAVMAVAVFLQLLVDHARNRDSTAIFGVYLLPLVLVVLLPLPYYMQFPTFLATTIYASAYVLIGVLLVGLLLVPTRDLPSILVFPGLLVVGVVGLVVLWYLEHIGASTMWSTVFTGLGYFNQSKLYSTIGEANRTGLGFIAASFGFFTFLLAFWPFGQMVRRGWRGQAPEMLMAAWSAIALFMAFAATRFISNAAPVFAILAGAAVSMLWGRIGLDEVRKRYRMQHGQNVVGAGAKSLTWRVVLGVFAIAVLIVLPNAWIGLDASMSYEYKEEKGLVGNKIDRFGAYGISFELHNNGWLGALDALAARDTCRSDPLATCQPGDPDYQPMEDRPGFIAWWDYGHWATSIGRHPTVADPFQNHYNLAGRFLAAESEEEGMAWLTILILDADWRKDGPGYSPAVQSVLSNRAPAIQDKSIGMGDEAYTALKPYISAGQVFDLYDEVSEATGKRIHYFGVDQRMYPYQNNAGIFYAPVYLSDKNPDEFVEQRCIGQTVNLKARQYGMDKQNRSIALKDVKWVDERDGKSEYYVDLRSGQAFSASNPEADPISCTPRVVQTDRYHNTMFGRAFGEPFAEGKAGDGLSHWRVIHVSSSGPSRLVNLLQYYKGVQVSGTVLDDKGSPVQGANVAFEDHTGARHQSAVTDANGTYTVLAPFSTFNATGGDLKLVAWMKNTVIAESSEYQFTLDQAMNGHSVTGADLVVSTVTVQGVVYRNVDTNTTYNASIDQPIGGVQVAVGNVVVESEADGTYEAIGVRPGEYTLIAKIKGYSDGNRPITINKDQPVQWQNISLNYQAAPVEVTFTDDGQPMPGIRVNATGAANRTSTTNETGVVTFQLQPGTYQIVVQDNVTDPVSGVERRYDLKRELVVPVGGDKVTLVIEAKDG
jgi:dolichyl-phosphooligosaccharide-protein glycotransferase